jgi:hypothetical protein
MIARKMAAQAAAMVTAMAMTRGKSMGWARFPWDLTMLRMNHTYEQSLTES